MDETEKAHTLPLSHSSTRSLGAPCSAAELESKTLLTWRVHLARQQPGKALIATALILTAAATIGLLSANAFWPLLAVFFLFFSLNDFYLPIRYRITEQGIEVSGPVSRNRIEWAQVRRFHTFPDGIKVSPLGRPSRLEAYRGVFLRCSGDTRRRVLDEIRQRIAVAD